MDKGSDAAAHIECEFSTATKEELMDHIALQRKLIRRLYKRIIELETRHEEPAVRKEAPFVVQPPQAAVKVVHSSPPPEVAESGYGAASVGRGRSPMFPRGQRATPRSPLHDTPSAQLYSQPDDPSQRAEDWMVATPQITARVADELSRVGHLLHLHESGEEVLPDAVVADLVRMEERLTLTLQSAMSNSLNNSCGNGDVEEYKFNAQLRGLSSHTAPREKATMEDVANCSQWQDSPFSSRTTTPRPYYSGEGQGNGGIVRRTPQPSAGLRSPTRCVTPVKDTPLEPTRLLSDGRPQVSTSSPPRRQQLGRNSPSSTKTSSAAPDTTSRSAVVQPPLALIEKLREQFGSGRSDVAGKRYGALSSSPLKSSPSQTLGSMRRQRPTVV